VRALVGRVWPRGVAKEHAQISQWMKEIASSNELRKLFAHHPARWQEFRKRYLKELESLKRQQLLAELRRLATQGTLTLAYGARTKRIISGGAQRGWCLSIGGKAVGIGSSRQVEQLKHQVAFRLPPVVG
jgi:uncharacterized protein YeaO (DUF488 family)